MDIDKKNSHASVLSALGASKGGHARAGKLSPADRSEIARAAATARWARRVEDGVLRETHSGALPIGDLEIACGVLENGVRILSTRGVHRAFGSTRTATAGPAENGERELPIFLASDALLPYLSAELTASLKRPVEYRPKHGGRSAFGYEAKLLPEICEALLEARSQDALRDSQLHIAEAAELIVRGLSRVGIIALVDEVTGYQRVRARQELQQILEAFIAKELLPWTKQFPDDFFENVYRLHGWEYRAGNSSRPGYVGTFINDFVYGRLPVGVLAELREKNPPDESGRRKYRHHQFLTVDIGHPHLRDHLNKVTVLMSAASSPPEFKRLVDRAFPVAGTQPELPLKGVG